MNAWLSGLLAVLFLVPSVGTSAQVESYLDRVIADGVPAAAVVLVEGGRVRALTARGRDASIDADTRFAVASLSKSFTATAVLQLVEAGAVDLDRPVSAYLPELRIDDPRAGAITVRHVLNQSSGLTDAGLGFDQYRPGPRTPAEAIDRLADSALSTDPGTSWEYCNANYWIAARLVEVVSGEAFGAYLRRHVFEPLGMTRTSHSDLPSGAGDVAPGHAYVGGRAVEVGAPEAFHGGSGGVVTSAADLGRWLTFQTGHRVSGQSGPVLGRALLAEGHRRQSPDRIYALGWYTGPPAGGGVERTSHSGVGAGVNAYAGLFPGDRAVGVLVAASSPSAYEIAQDALDLASGKPVDGVPGPPAPWSDVFAVTVCAALVALVGRGLRRARGWLTRSTPARRGIVLVGLALLASVLLALPGLVGALIGRQASWSVLFTSAPVPVVATLVVAGAVWCLVLVRAGLLLARRRPVATRAA